MESSKTAAFVRGLLEGLKLDKSTPERELIVALVETVAALADENDALRTQLTDLAEEVELLDSGINSVLDILEENEADDEEHEGCGCGKCHGHKHGGEADDEKLELPCPACSEVIDISEQMFEDGHFVCPHCEAKLELDMGHHHDHDDGCDCGHDH